MSGNGSKSVARVREALAAHGLDGRVRETPASTRTADDAAAAVGCAVGQIVKSLLFVDASDTPYLVLVSGANRADTDRLAAEVGEPLRLADPRTVRDVTGFAIGGVAPVGLRRPVPVLMDADLLAFDRVWAAAGLPNAVFPIPPDALRRITDARAVNVA